MKTTKAWQQHFITNAKIQRVNWCQLPRISQSERSIILKSLQAWQLGETSEGTNLLAAATRYAKKHQDEGYPEVIKLFIKEEQKHGGNLGLYLDLIGEERIKYNWGDSLFRSVRYFMTSIEIWTMAVLTVESAAQIFYQALKDATNCPLLKEICTDILIDEAAHITFQYQRMAIIFNQKVKWQQLISLKAYRVFFWMTSRIIWLDHKAVFIAGGLTRENYIRKMELKFDKTFGRLNAIQTPSLSQVMY